MYKLGLKQTVFAVVIGVGGIACTSSAVLADDVNMHQFWEDQQTTSSAQNPATRVPDSGRATYQDDEGQTTTAAPTGHRVKHQRHRAQN